MEFFLDNWIIIMFFSGVTFLTGAFFAIQEHKLIKTKTDIIISKIGWHWLIPIGVISCIFSIICFLLNIILERI
jgi:hypothetical protein